MYIASALWDSDSRAGILAKLLQWVREVGVLRLLPKVLQGMARVQIEQASSGRLPRRSTSRMRSRP